MQPVLRAKEKVQEEVFGSTSDTNYFFNPYLLEGSTRWLDALRKHNVIQAAAIPVLFRLIEHSLETATIDLRAIIDVMKAIGIDTYPEDMASQVLVRIDALSNVLRGLASVIEPTISNHSMRKSRD
jgi:hypothetical protein